MVAYATIMIIVVPIGVPLFYFILLFNRRHAIFKMDHSKPFPSEVSGSSDVEFQALLKFECFPFAPGCSRVNFLAYATHYSHPTIP